MFSSESSLVAREQIHWGVSRQQPITKQQFVQIDQEEGELEPGKRIVAKQAEGRADLHYDIPEQPAILKCFWEIWNFFGNVVLSYTSKLWL